MIYVPKYKYGSEYQEAILFPESKKPVLVKVLERGINTLSPPDHDLIKLLEDMKK